jgi:hypothetical protein
LERIIAAAEHLDNARSAKQSEPVIFTVVDAPRKEALVETAHQVVINWLSTRYLSGQSFSPHPGGGVAASLQAYAYGHTPPEKCGLRPDARWRAGA